MKNEVNLMRKINKILILLIILNCILLGYLIFKNNRINKELNNTQIYIYKNE